MLSAIRRRLHLSPATVIAGLALVFAMTGGAYAAKKYLITSTKQISPSVLKQLQGKAGAAGTPGAQGVPGAQGAQGPAGPAGTAGAGGGKGETGAKGEKGATGATGSKGATGATGVSGFTEKLPKDKTETGTWAVAGVEYPQFSEVVVPISFPIPLSAAGALVYLNLSETEAGSKKGGCEGTAAVPTAPAGTLCIYTGEETRSGFGAPEFRIDGTENEYEPAGTIMRLFHAEKEASTLVLNGSWAVTAP